MAIKELFYDNRPQVLLDPRASQRIDPRFKFTRNSVGTYVDRDGLIKTAQPNEPRIEYDFSTGEYRGLLVEKSSVNLLPSNIAPVVSTFVGFGSSQTTATTVLPDGETGDARSITWGPSGDLRVRFLVTYSTTTPHVFSVYWKYPSDSIWQRYKEGTRITGVAGAVFVDINAVNNEIGTYGETVYLAFGQIEAGTVPTSYIRNSGGGTATRAADLLSIESPLPASGSVYIDARAISANENDTLLSLKNSSNDKIDLAYLSNTDTYNSLALIASYKVGVTSTNKPSLPLPVPTTGRERNIITWGANNYQYTRGSSRFAPSLSSSTPTDLNQLSIGHDAVDPTKAFNGYINTVYAWSGELTPAVAEALIRSDLDPINADTYSPTGPAGSLALVINTQGATASGEKTFTLPAESAANDNDIVITWGDGTESSLSGSEAELGASGLTHTYPAAGIYPFWVEGKLQNIQFNNIANAADILELVNWGTDLTFTAPSTIASAFYGCSQMDFSSSARNTTNLPDTSAVTDWYRAFRDCSSITGAFPAFTFTAATTFQEAWQGCSSMTSFVTAGDQTQNVTNFSNAWYNCNSLTAFPQINTSSGTSFANTWRGCSSLTDFPLINTAAGTNFTYTWQGCSDLDNITNAGESSSFPPINTASGTTFNGCWYGCSSMTVFPSIDTSSSTNFSDTWRNCAALTSFPLLDTGLGTTFLRAWASCASINNIGVVPGATTSFPAIDTSSGENFAQAWFANASLTVFPALNFDAATGLASDEITTYTGFREAWRGCTSLTTFPANLFDNTTCTRYLDAFRGCALTATSIENIIVSIEAAGTSDGNLSLEGGTNAGASTWTAAAVTAYDALVARGWTITRNA